MPSLFPSGVPASIDFRITRLDSVRAALPSVDDASTREAAALSAWHFAVYARVCYLLCWLGILSSLRLSTNLRLCQDPTSTYLHNLHRLLYTPIYGKKQMINLCVCIYIYIHMRIHIHTLCICWFIVAQQYSYIYIYIYTYTYIYIGMYM